MHRGTLVQHYAWGIFSHVLDYLVADLIFIARTQGKVLKRKKNLMPLFERKIVEMQSFLLYK